MSLDNKSFKRHFCPNFFPYLMIFQISEAPTLKNQQILKKNLRENASKFFINDVIYVYYISPGNKQFFF